MKKKVYEKSSNKDILEILTKIGKTISHGSKHINPFKVKIQKLRHSYLLEPDLSQQNNSSVSFLMYNCLYTRTFLGLESLM